MAKNGLQSLFCWKVVCNEFGVKQIRKTNIIVAVLVLLEGRMQQRLTKRL